MHHLGGQQYGHYRLIRRIGAGSFSEVYLGEHLTAGSLAAIKVLPTDLTDSVRQAFLIAIHALQRLVHPHILHLHTYGIEGEFPFLVMDYAPGGNLRTRHPRGSIIPLPLVVTYVTQLSLALHAAHEAHVIHQDLKPENILLGDDGSLLLSDFSLALSPPSGQTLTYLNAQAVVGTLGYMAPEQFRGRASRASDQYALAVMIYEWLTGTLPFGGTIAQLCHQHLFTPAPSLCAANPAIPRAVEQVVEKALAKDPDQRFADVIDFASAFELASHGVLPPLLVSFASPASPSLPAERGDIDSLPAPLTSLLGRDQERAAATALLLGPSTRLVNLVGTGGVGKTRLALAVATDLREAFADGVCFVPLATTSTTDQVITAIAQALKVQTGNRSIFEIVQAFLQEKHLLLVLDNFEQVAQAAPQLTILLATCPCLKLLITSRETLHVSGEHVFEVPPLALPDLNKGADLELLLRNPAVALFVERAQACKPDFLLTSANARTVAAICIQLDGLPLAIELAAARITLLPPHMLLPRLSHRLSLLTTGRRDAPARQQTLRATIKWSYDLLTVAEQALFRRLCIFVGGCTLQALETLIDELGDDPVNVVEGVASLLDKNLARRGEQEEELRVVVLETIREFGLECLKQLGEWEQVQQVHTRYYLRWAEQACKAVFSREQMRWIRGFVEELGNMRAVMEHLLAQSEREGALRLGAWLGPIWFLWGSANQYIYMLEGKHFLEQALAESSEGEGWARARALVFYGGMLAVLREAGHGSVFGQQGLAYFRQKKDLQAIIQSLWMVFYTRFVPGHLREARQAAEEALALSQQHPEVCTEWGAAWTQGYSSFLAGYVAVWEGRYAEAKQFLLNSSSLLAQAGDAFVSAWTTLLRSEAAVFEGSEEEATTLLEQGLSRYRALGMMVLVAEAISLQGYLALRAGKVNRARTLLSESLRLSQEVRDERRTAWSQIWLARVALREQQIWQARHLLTEALDWATRKHDGLMLALGLEGWAQVAAAQGEAEWAARLYASAQALREATGAPIPLVDQAGWQEQIAMIRASLGEEAFQTAWKQGGSMTPEQVIMEQRTTSLPVTAEKTPVPALAESRATEAEVSLTRREREVLGLIAEGLSSAQIADKLVVSVGTVNGHLRRIYRKLGVSSRTAAIRFGIDHRLLSTEREEW